MKRVLKDPDSAKYSFEIPPRKSWVYDFTLHGNVFGWVVCSGINAKNSFGGYTGEQPFAFLFKDQKLAGVEQMGERVRRMCVGEWGIANKS